MEKTTVQKTIARRYGAEYLEAAGHGHMLMLEDDWEPPFNKILAWLGRATHRCTGGG